jgi:transcriptional regulator
MHVKPIYEPNDLHEIHALIEQAVVGTLVAAAPRGLTAAHLPFMVDPRRGEYGTLVCHLAAANPQAELVRAGEEMMAIFMSPNAYVSASWYVERDRAPTWAYAAVHCHGRPRVQDAQESLRNIGALVNRLEGGRRKRWRFGELGTEGVSERMQRIVCFDMPIERLEARFQLGQEERPADMAAAAIELDQQGDHDVAALVRQYSGERGGAGHVPRGA